MKIKYELSNQRYSYDALGDLSKVSCLLSNIKGDFVQFAAQGNPTKFFGFHIANPKTFEIFKIIDEIILQGEEVAEVFYNGYEFERRYKSHRQNFVRVPVDEKTRSDHTFGEHSVLDYNDEGILEEVVDMEFPVSTSERFFLGPSGGLVYEIRDFDGEVLIDFDVRKFYDFDQWGRNFERYVKGGVIIFKYVKQKGDSSDYEIFVGMKAANLKYDIVDEWTEKFYPYSAARGSLSDWYVYRPLKIQVMGSKRIVFGAGFSEQEVLEQIALLDNHQDELVNFEAGIVSEMFSVPEFKDPLPQDVEVAYKLSRRGVYAFLNKDFDLGGSYAGLPWFGQVWSRDDLIGMRALINMGEYGLVKERLFAYLHEVSDFGTLKRLMTISDSQESVDAMFLLAKRIEDLVYALDSQQKLADVISTEELEYVYRRLSGAFYRFISGQWDKNEELIRVKYADSWMDTVGVNLPLDIQVGLLEYVSVLGFLGQILQKDECDKFLDLENLLREKIRKSYFRNGRLYNEPYEDKLTCNVFLAYYLYPDLFFKSEWEEIFDKALVELKSPWGGIATLSKKNPVFKDEYSGENNESYHNGDVWFWINNVSALVMADVNERKYRGVISGILLSSTKDILRMGTIGFGSEISSFKEQRAEGCLAQLWSSSTYIEMVEKLFNKKG